MIKRIIAGFSALVVLGITLYCCFLVYVCSILMSFQPERYFLTIGSAFGGVIVGFLVLEKLIKIAVGEKSA